MKGKGKDRKKKRKEKESYIFIFYITFDITGGGLLVFFDNEQLLELKIIDLFLMLKKVK